MIIGLLISGILFFIGVAALQVMAEAHRPTGSGRIPGLVATIIAALLAVVLVVALILKFAGVY